MTTTVTPKRAIVLPVAGSQEPFKVSQFVNAITTLDTWSGTTDTNIAGLQKLTARASSDAGRLALFPAPVADDRVYRTDKGYDQVYDGTKWLGAGGLVRVKPTGNTVGTINPDGSVSFAGVNAITLNGMFNADFTDYRVVVDIDTRTVASDMYANWAIGGAAQVDAVYSRRAYQVAGNANAASTGVDAGTSFQVDNGSIGIGAPSQIILEISKPFVATKPIVGTGQAASFVSASAGYWTGYAFTYQRNVAVDGMKFFPTAGGFFDGTIQVFGYGR